MALSVPKAPGVAQMLKDGARVSRIFNNNSMLSGKKQYELVKNSFENAVMLSIWAARAHVNRRMSRINDHAI